MESKHSVIWQDALPFLTRELKAERALVLETRPEGDPVVIAAHGVDAETLWTVGEVSHDILRKAAAGESLLLTDALHDPKFRDRSSVVISSLRSIVCAPVKGSGGVLGVLYADSQSLSGLFGPPQLSKLEMFARELAERLEKA